MPFQVSPGVNVSEFDLTTVIPAVSTTEGALAGPFRWGPCDKYLLIDSENVLWARYGKPTNFNPETFFVGANFLSYGNKLYVSRAANTAGWSNTYSGVTIEAANAVLAGVNSASANIGDLIYGTYIAEGTVVLSTNSSAIVMSKAATGTETGVLAFANPNTVFSAVANSGVVSTALANYVVKNEDDFETKSFESDVHFVARYPGALGNSLKISQCDSANQFSASYDLVANAAYVLANSGTIALTVGSNTANVTFVAANGTITEAEIANVAANVQSKLIVGDYLEVGNSSVGKQFLKITSLGTVGNVATTNDIGFFTLSFDEPYQLAEAFTSNTVTRYWEFWNNVDNAPGRSNFQTAHGNTSANDEVHIVVVDQDGALSGVPGTILEVYEGLSRATNAVKEDGEGNYLKNVINKNSEYVWLASDRPNASGNAALYLTSSTNSKPLTLSFLCGSDGLGEVDIPLNVVMKAYDKFASAEDIDISLILTGKSRGGTHGEQLANYLIDNIAEVRKDCVVFASTEKSDVVSNAGKDEALDTKQWADVIRSTSYAVLDSGYKYQYDKYNDVYRYIPYNGDIAGLCVRTDETRDPWWSPAGFNRGQLKNVIKPAFNPRKAERDILYKARVNPVVAFPGEGTVLYGDKTALTKPSAFDRINVRRLFIVLEKAIATAAKYSLFEFNDEFTRAQFKSMVEPFLRDVMGRRGIYDFRVVCDETNNTGEVIDRNEFVADLYIKPARSINYIQLNFVAVRSGVAFEEIVGKF